MNTIAGTHEIISLSTQRSPHTRHIARLIDNAIRPDGLRTTIALTACDRLIRHPQKVDDVGDHFTDGTVYTIDCPACARAAEEYHEYHAG
jgi:hypothetical protein